MVLYPSNDIVITSPKALSSNLILHMNVWGFGVIFATWATEGQCSSLCECLVLASLSPQACIVCVDTEVLVAGTVDRRDAWKSFRAAYGTSC